MSQQFSRELFEQQLKIGQKYEEMICKRLEGEGITVHVQGNKNITDYTKQQKDIIVPRKSGDFIIEVKSRNLWFISPYTFPFEDFVLETVWGWEQKERQPDAIVIVSQVTNISLAVNVAKSKHAWTKRKQWDGLREIESFEYFIPKEYLMKFETLVEYLKK